MHILIYYCLKIGAGPLILTLSLNTSSNDTTSFPLFLTWFSSCQHLFSFLNLSFCFCRSAFFSMTSIRSKDRISCCSYIFLRGKAGELQGKIRVGRHFWIIIFMAQKDSSLQYAMTLNYSARLFSSLSQPAFFIISHSTPLPFYVSNIFH